jgi:hypothetical protein
MDSRLVNSSVVVAAHHFNPSVFSQLWLVRNNIVSETEFLTGCVFTDMIANIRTHAFELLVTQDQCQFSPLGGTEAHQTVIVEKVGSVIRLLPHTPFTAMGLNFIWHVEPLDVSEFGRTRFCKCDAPLYDNFNCEDARFGAYLSKDALGFRLKIDIKPLTMTISGASKELFQFSFNFHSDISGDSPLSDIEPLLARWDEARVLSQELMRTTIEGGLSP